jgi:parallel beta-helix repeat protein
MKKKITLLGLIFLALTAKAAQYNTPGTGVKWSFADLVTNSGGFVTNDQTNGANNYLINDTINISATDEIIVNSDITVRIAKGAEITFQSSTFTVNAPTLATFTAKSQIVADVFGVFNFNDAAKANLKNAKFTFGKGIKVSLTTGSFTANNCEFSDNYYSSSTAGAITLSKGYATVTNSKFLRNTRAAISSGANTASTFYFANNYLEGNTTDNSNRPQINLGPCAEGDTTKILNNTIIGNRSLTMAGGISTSSLLSVPCSFIIKGNTIKDNRYGITLTGSNVYGEITGNIIQNNNTQNLPNSGGSGINITSSTGTITTKISGNKISGNLWGITSVGNTSTYSNGPKVNLGNLSVPKTDPEYNPGLNEFSNNGNGGILYDFYNNSPINVMAQGNTWGVTTQDSASIETVVVHKVDNAKYGFVTFTAPKVTSVTNPDNTKFNIYPNPVQTSFNIDIENKGLEITDLTGKLIISHKNSINYADVSQLENGMYIVKVYTADNKVLTSRFLKVK